MDAVKSVSWPRVRSEALNERIWISELGCVQECVSCAYLRCLRSF